MLLNLLVGHLAGGGASGPAPDSPSPSSPPPLAPSAAAALPPLPALPPWLLAAWRAAAALLSRDNPHFAATCAALLAATALAKALLNTHYNYQLVGVGGGVGVYVVCVGGCGCVPGGAAWPGLAWRGAAAALTGRSRPAPHRAARCSLTSPSPALPPSSLAL
jgi:hypothetical protein